MQRLEDRGTLAADQGRQCVCQDGKPLERGGQRLQGTVHDRQGGHIPREQLDVPPQLFPQSRIDRLEPVVELAHPPVGRRHGRPDSTSHRTHDERVGRQDGRALECQGVDRVAHRELEELWLEPVHARSTCHVDRQLPRLQLLLPHHVQRDRDELVRHHVGLGGWIL